MKESPKPVIFTQISRSRCQCTVSIRNKALRWQKPLTARWHPQEHQLAKTQFWCISLPAGNSEILKGKRQITVQPNITLKGLLAALATKNALLHLHSGVSTDTCQTLLPVTKYPCSAFSPNTLKYHYL